jgi:hypothetical protein
MIFEKQFRHPELVSGSISPLYSSGCVERWMLKQVQHDGDWGGEVAHRLSASPRLCSNHFSRHPREGGGPSPDRSVCRKRPVMDSRLRGNDEVWGGEVVLESSASPHFRVNHCSRHPVLDTGLGFSSQRGPKSQAPHQVRGDGVDGDGVVRNLSASLRLCANQK